MSLEEFETTMRLVKQQACQRQASHTLFTHVSFIPEPHNYDFFLRRCDSSPIALVSHYDINQFEYESQIMDFLQETLDVDEQTINCWNNVDSLQRYLAPAKIGVLHGIRSFENNFARKYLLEDLLPTADSWFLLDCSHKDGFYSRLGFTNTFMYSTRCEPVLER